MSSLLERMTEGFDSFFDELNKVSASELIAELDDLGLIADVQEDNVVITSASVSFGTSNKNHSALHNVNTMVGSFDELKYAA